MPALAKEDSLEGQKAFIQYWLDTYNYMRESEDPTLFVAACDKGSKFCSGSVKNLKDYQDVGAWLVGGTIQMGKINRETANTAETRASFTIPATEAVSQYYDTSGPSPHFKQRTKESQYLLTLVLEKTTSGWVLFECGSDKR